jgi:hypothetical protein
LGAWKVTDFQKETEDRRYILMKILQCRKVRDLYEPDYYELLDVDFNCTDKKLIESNYSRKYGELINIKQGSALGQRRWNYIQALIKELTQAKMILTDPARRTAYNSDMKENKWKGKVLEKALDLADANNKMLTDANVRSLVKSGEDYHLDESEVMDVLRDLESQGKVIIGQDGESTQTGSGKARTKTASKAPRTRPSYSSGRTRSARGILIFIACILVGAAVASLFKTKGGGMRKDQIYEAILRNDSGTQYLVILRAQKGVYDALNLSTQIRRSFTKKDIVSMRLFKDQGSVVQGALQNERIWVETISGVKVAGTVLQNGDGKLTVRDATGRENQFIKPVIQNSGKM